MQVQKGIMWNVASVKREGPEAVRVRIEPLQPKAVALQCNLAGGYVTFTLPTSPRLRRTYSVLHQDERGLEYVVKNVRGGQASRFFSTTLKAGDPLEMMDFGNALWQPEWDERPQHFIAFAGGIGMSPIVSCMNRALKSDVGHRFTLYESSRSERRRLFSRELDTLRKYPLCSVYQLYTETQNRSVPSTGRITRERVIQWLEGHPNASSATYLISAPHGMMEAVHRGLDALDVPMTQRFTEHFTDRPLSHESHVLHPTASKATRPQCKLEIEQDSGCQSFTMHGEGQSILHAATAAGVDVPTSCSGGICLSCQAQVIEGEVQPYGISGLTEEEKAKGMVLCCRSQPKSERLKLRLIN